MKAIICELCGSNQLIKTDGLFQCEHCGTKYTLEEARKLFANVHVEGEVQTKDADFIIKAGTLEAYNGESTVVFIPENVKAIRDSCFKGQLIEKVQIPNGVTSIGHWAFWGCTNLTSITLPDSVTSIDGAAFENCTSLTRITIPNGVTSINYQTFAGCTCLTQITIPKSVTSIGDYAFSKCTSLSDITIPDSVTSIGRWAFQSCSNLTSVTLPDSLTNIGYNAFSDCTKLKSITIPDSVTNIDAAAFIRCPLDPQNTRSPIYSFPMFPKYFNDQGYCRFCAGKLKKGMFSTKCTRCGKAVDPNA